MSAVARTRAVQSGGGNFFWWVAGRKYSHVPITFPGQRLEFVY